uniref:U36-Theriditoxin-Lha1b_1 n=1 Tax=Latrodectus hasselti TaxID=256736 RepID=A0A482ZDR1_LATHA
MVTLFAVMAMVNGVLSWISHFPLISGILSERYSTTSKRSGVSQSSEVPHRPPSIVIQKETLDFRH